MSYQVISPLSQHSNHKPGLVWFRQKMTKLWPMKMDWSCKSLFLCFSCWCCSGWWYLKLEQKTRSDLQSPVCGVLLALIHPHQTTLVRRPSISHLAVISSYFSSSSSEIREKIINILRWSFKSGCTVTPTWSMKWWNCLTDLWLTWDPTAFFCCRPPVSPAVIKMMV